MSLKSLLLGAGAALFLSAGAASAAVVTTSLHLRTGPSVHDRVIGTMPTGSHVSVLNCGGAWCRVSFRGERGYASRHFISGVHYAYRRSYYAEPYYTYDEPDYGYGWGPGFFFGGYHYHHGFHHYRHFGFGGGYHHFHFGGGHHFGGHHFGGHGGGHFGGHHR